MDKKLYLKSPDIFLMKIDHGWIEFIDGEDGELIHPEDIPFLHRAFNIPIEVLEDFYYN